MNREQKAAAVAEIAENIKESEAVFAVDYRGLSVPQANELRSRLRGADARFTIVKNTLTERAADAAGAESLKELLEGPTALTFVRGDAAAAAKALRDYARETDLLPFKGGFMDGNALTAEDIGAIARLPSREMLYAQLVGIVAHPISGLARTLNQLIGGLAIALGQIQEQGLVGKDAPAAEAAPAEPAAEAPPEETAPEATSDAAPEADAAETPTESAEETPPAEEDPDAGPASDPEPAQPDQAEGEDTPEETS
ncbi:MAG TPA: 50S ribosomal protein L10 [Solirubrobacteraceae bacterium]|jgi:large subunit ribosomal protein L10